MQLATSANSTKHADWVVASWTQSAVTPFQNHRVVAAAEEWFAVVDTQASSRACCPSHISAGMLQPGWRCAEDENVRRSDRRDPAPTI